MSGDRSEFVIPTSDKSEVWVFFYGAQRRIWLRAQITEGWRPTPHDLRHAMVTWALEAGVSPRAVQFDAGHARCVRRTATRADW